MLALAGMCASTLLAQDENPSQDTTVQTFHAYSNLVQIPTLVLSQDRNPLGPIAPDRFFVSVDSGARFRVSHVRLEGDDPISLAILLDVNQPFPDLIKGMGDAIAHLAPASLHPPN